MHAAIRYLLTPDIDPATFSPADPGKFMFLVQMLAGPADGPGEESFQFEVCTPAWLHERARREGPVTGRHQVIVDTFDWPSLQRFFQRLATRCSGTDWREVATKLSRYGHWEFEDYTPRAGNT
ncbi:hypothetical protein F3087_29335 [Nocardia colli]|uniref:Immunity protein 8 of polymorphic toxin system n=1 Tax=Nocardia colli TaxID=2545717 RepID=A0A5N0E9Y0_9NOCA|nr:immunity 8 family protein [Nocardia colli]KAA8885733.1 hypothetical protein F3087_29335 [Nocardia colli]